MHKHRLSLGHVAQFYLDSDICCVQLHVFAGSHSFAIWRLQVLLGLVLDIKNNRQRSQGTGSPLTIAAVLSAGVLKWLRGTGIDEVQLRNISWQRVLQAGKKVSCPMIREHQRGARSPGCEPCDAGRRM
jgi:hypothetical protein